MSNLNDFLNLIAEGKRVAVESHPGKRLLKELEQTLHSSNPFIVEQSTATPENNIEQITESGVVIIGEFAMKDGVFVDNTIGEAVEIRPAAQVHTASEIDKYLRRNASFQQPDPDVVDPNVKAIQEKLKFLEQAIGRIAATGPGSGEVWFRWLDDVDRSTIDTPESNQEHVLRYNAVTKKFFFGELTGDHREINSFTFDEDGPNIETTPRMVYWNKNEDCLNIDHEDGSSMQVGYDNFIEIRNASGQTLNRGTVVRFSGVYSNGDYVPEAVPHIADGTIPPLFTIGVVVVDIENQQNGRAILLGKARDVDTTGDSVSEIWNEGDILYVHPTLPGKLTKNKPTAPQVVISVAAVLFKDATDGILLVRPTIFPRLFYGTFADKTNQTQTAINTPKAITFNTTEVANGHRLGTDTSRVIADNSGLYNYKFSVQLISTNSSAKDVFIWFRKNGVDIADSATRKTIVGNGVYDVAAWDITVSMQPNDYFQIMWATTDTTVSITSPPATAFCPAIPSVILNVTEVAL